MQVSSPGQPPRDDAGADQHHGRRDRQRTGSARVGEGYPQLHRRQPHRVPRAARVEVRLGGSHRPVEVVPFEERLRGSPLPRFLRTGAPPWAARQGRIVAHVEVVKRSRRLSDNPRTARPECRRSGVLRRLLPRRPALNDRTCPLKHERHASTATIINISSFRPRLSTVLFFAARRGRAQATLPLPFGLLLRTLKARAISVAPTARKTTPMSQA